MNPSNGKLKQITQQDAGRLLQSNLNGVYCDLGKVFDDINVLPLQSSSPTVQAIVSIKPSEASQVLIDYVNRRKSEGKSSQIFVKFMPKVLSSYNRDAVEVAIYKYLYENLVISSITPHIMNYVASAQCSQIGHNLSWIQDDKLIEDYLKDWTMNDEDYEDMDIDEIKDKLKMGRILLTEMGEGTSLRKMYTSGMFDVNEFDSVAFQVGYTLKQMSEVGIRHNDLHLDNIWINISNTRKQRVYNVNGKYYLLNTRYFVKIYDFDLATFTTDIPWQLINEFLTMDQRCTDYGICSTADPLYDWYTFCSLHNQLYYELRAELKSLMSKPLNPHNMQVQVQVKRYMNKFKEFLGFVELDPEIFSTDYQIFEGRFCAKAGAFIDSLTGEIIEQCDSDGVVPSDKLASFDDLIDRYYFDSMKIKKNKIPPLAPIYISL